MKVAVLGAGLVGRPIAVDLSKDRQFEVTAVDRSDVSLERINRENPNIATVRKDLMNPKDVTVLAAGFDWVVSAVPGFMGFETLRAVIQAGKNVVDIAFFPEDPSDLDDLAKEKGVTAIVDCGVAPGMSNILAGYAHHLLDKTDSVLIYVGGLPQVREWPYEYKAVFSPIDVIEEYTRPARFVENGREVVRPALSDPELLSFAGIGTLEAFNSDGLRTLAKTIDAPNMKEKTLRYPGHIEKMAVLRETGFFGKEEIEIRGLKIRPLDFTAKLLFPKWELKQGEEDLTIMQIVVQGERGKEKLRYTYDLLDRYCPETKTHSMARTTGYTATVALRMLAAGLYTHKGISPPEYIGRHKECVDFMLKGLKERGVEYTETVEHL
jgi:saccharopine dehydrogenase-like NADP-dependent oxidoreductase